MRFSTRALFLCAFFCCLAFAVARLWWMYFGEGAAHRVEKSLEAMEEIEDVEVVGFWDSPFDYKIAELSITLHGGGSLLLQSPSTDLQGAFGVHSIGAYEVKFTGQSTTWFHFPQYGPAGDLTPLLPEAFSDIKSLVRNYEIALDTIGNWPSSESEALEVEGAGGKYLVWREEI